MSPLHLLWISIDTFTIVLVTVMVIAIRDELKDRNRKKKERRLIRRRLEECLRTKGPRMTTIKIDANGSTFTYAGPNGEDFSTVHVRNGDMIRWSCDKGNHSVLFKSNSPLDAIGAHGPKGSATDWRSVTGEPGTYTYGVVISVDGALLMDDPIIIIDGD